jgi:chromatin remodeling complex protein RSC6
MSTTEQMNTSETQSTSQSSLSQQLHALQEQVDAQISVFRDMSKALKKLDKEVAREQKRASKPVKTKRQVKQTPVAVNAAMSKFLTSQGVEGVDGKWTRQVMMKEISAYIKAKGLQLEEDKKKWKPDATLMKLFSLEKGTLYTFMNVNGLISRVVA